MNKGYIFICPKCKTDSYISAIDVDVCIENLLTFDKDGNSSYESIDTFGGILDRYVCNNCGYVLPEKDEDEIFEKYGIKEGEQSICEN